MIDTIREWLAGNQFFSGGALLALIGSAAFFLRKWLLTFLRWAWRQCVVSLEVRNTEVAFEWMVLWLDRQPYTRRARRVTVSLGAAHSRVPQPAQTSNSRDNGDDHPLIVFSPAAGDHVFRFRRRPVWLKRERQDQPARSGDYQIRDRESFTIWTLGRSQHCLREMVEEAYRAYTTATKDEVRVYTSVYESWTAQGFVRPRSLESVILPGDEKERLLADIRRFLASEPWYREMGIPYRRGYLLAGTPGSGKSSLVAAVASAIGMHLYVVNLASTYGDNALVNLLQNISVPRAIVLFEDIDCASAAQDRTKRENQNSRDWVTVGGLLNALDGVSSRDGCITIMTTNHRDILDPALTRPGRVDLELAFRYATVEQMDELYERFYGRAARHAYAGVRHRLMPTTASMASLQEHFLRHRDDPAAGAHLVSGEA